MSNGYLQRHTEKAQLKKENTRIRNLKYHTNTLTVCIIQSHIKCIQHITKNRLSSKINIHKEK